MATYSSIKEASDAYYKAKANNDAAGMKAANDAANKIRASQGQKAQYATGDISGVAQRASSNRSGSGSSGSYTASGSGGSYAIGSDKGKNFISSAAAGSTMTGGDGSTWRKNSDGTTTISKGGQTWTYGPSSGGDSSGSSGGSSSGGGASGSSGTVRVTLPTGEVIYSRYANGHVTDDLPTGSIVHTAGGDYRVTGGSAGNYTSDLVGDQQYTDYSILLNNAINYAKQQNEAQLAANLANLRGAYDQSMLEYENTRKGINPTYQAQRNATAANSDVNWGAFNEAAAANGLNTGAAGQAALSRSVTLQNNLNDLNKSEAEELSKIDLEVAKLTAEYNSAIAKAKASGAADLAAALYQQFNNYIEQKQTERANAQALQQAQQEAQANAQKDAYDTVLDLITSGIMPTESQLAAAGMTKADAEALYYQVIQQQAAKSSGGRSGGSGGSNGSKKKKSSSGGAKTQSTGTGGSGNSVKPVDLNSGLNQIASANAGGSGGNYADVSRELLNMRRSGSSDKTMADWLEKQIDNGIISAEQAYQLTNAYGINIDAQSSSKKTNSKKTSGTKVSFPKPIYKNPKSTAKQAETFFNSHKK